MYVCVSLCKVKNGINNYFQKRVINKNRCFKYKKRQVYLIFVFVFFSVDNIKERKKELNLGSKKG